MKIPLIAIVGRPNVGKSTLFNRLSGKRKALVRDEPGTTRDRQYEKVFWDRYEFNLVDTGGVSLGHLKSLDQKVTEQALYGIDEADLVLFLFDARAPMTSEDKDWLEWARKLQKPKLFVANKVDSDTQEVLSSEFYETGIREWILTSAETGRGVSLLLDRIVELLLPEPSLPEEAVEDSFNIAIIGRPNVGKSTLLNQFAGTERAVVDDVAGTTRDPIDTLFDYEGSTYRLVDTAGIRKKGKTEAPLEIFSVMRSLKSVERSDCVLMMVNALEGITEQDAHVVGEAFKRYKALLLLVNKWDEAKSKTSQKEIHDEIFRKLRFIDYCPVLFVSAKTGLGIDKIMPTIARIRLQYEKRVSTAELNRVFESIVQNHPLPVYSGKNIKIFYATQAEIKPPTFIVFCNQPSKVHFSYKRYLVNALSEAFDLKEVPVKVIFKKSS